MSVKEKKPKHDSEYYLDTVIFLVENCLFKVPRYFLAQHSDIFQATFSLPSTDGSAEGNSDENPFKLEGIEKNDFRSLLRVIYPQHPIKPINLSHAEWISVLKLSTMWNFLEIRKCAIDKLSEAKIDAIDKVLLAKAHKIPSWLIAGYNDLIRRRATITVEEAMKLGTETTVFLFQIREEVASTEYSYGYGTREHQDFTDIVKRKFQVELKDVEAASVAFTSAIHDNSFI